MNNKCNDIKEKIQNFLDENIQADKSVKQHLSYCPDCREFYNRAKKISKMLIKSFNIKSLYNKKPDFTYILNKAGRFRKVLFIRRLAFQFAAFFIFIVLGFSSYFGINKLYWKIKLKNEISYFIGDIFQDSYFDKKSSSENTRIYNNDWRNDFETEDLDIK